MPGKARILYIGNKLAVHGRTPGNIDTLGPLLQQQGYTMYYSSSKVNKLMRLADMLQNIIRYRNKVDVVLIDTFSTSAFYFAWLCGMLCRKLDIKYIPILRGGNLPYRMSKSPEKCRQLFGNSFTNITVSAYLQQQLQAKGLKTELVENHIELRNYPFMQRELLSPRLLWVRAFHQTYNPPMAVSVLASLLKDGIDATLTMVGPELDGSMQQCKELAKQEDVYERITFTGKLSKQEWTKLSQDADVFINTTNYDNLPVSVIEAMALGMPVVSTNAGGVPFLIKNRENGLLVDVSDVEGMKKAVQLLLVNKNLAAKLSAGARETAAAYDWQVLKCKWANLLQQVV